MLNNLTNFLALQRGKAVKTSADPDDVIVLGVPDKRFEGGYKPAMIKVKDFGGGGPSGPVCDITMEQKPITFGPEVIVSVDLLTQLPPVDVLIPGVLEVQFDQGGITWYNVIDFSTPGWNTQYTGGPSGFANLSDIQSRTYGFWNIYSGVNEETVMYHSATDTYWKFLFTSFNWKTEFTYTRSQIFLPDLCKLTFSDGSILNSASGLVEGNSVTEVVNLDGSITYQISDPVVAVNYSNVAFVDLTHGNNSTGIVGRFDKPFQSISSALAAVAALGPYSDTLRGLVYLRKGTYGSFSFALPDRIDVHAEDGVVVIAGGGITDTVSTGKKFRLTGNAVFQGSINWLFTINSDAQVELNFYSADIRGLVQCNNTARVVINCKWLKLSGYNGGGYSISPRDNTYLEVNAQEYIFSQHILLAVRNGITGGFAGKCYIRSPRIEVIPTYTSNYGNIFKAFLTTFNPAGSYIEFEGEMVISSSVPGVGGDNRSGFALLNCFGGQWDLVIKGDVFVANNECIRRGYQGFYGKCRVYGDLKSLTSPINTNNLNSTSVGDYTFEFHNTKFYGTALQGGRGTKTYFKECSFYNYADGVSFPTAPNISFQTSNAPLGSEYYFYNCIGETNGATSEFLTNGSVPTILGLWNTAANRPLGVGAVDSFGGFTEVAGINVPKLL